MLGWKEDMEERVVLRQVLFLNCEKDIMLKRLMHRAKVSGRTDDNIESIEKRFDTYREQTSPIIEMFREKGKVNEVYLQSTSRWMCQGLLRKII